MAAMVYSAFFMKEEEKEKKNNIKQLYVSSWRKRTKVI